jgi:very-short-patch-repair endonuclease
VIERLIARGYLVRPQVEAGHYRIDMVVSDGRTQVALECDGDRFHPVEKIPEDLARQAVLERAGWRFVRLRGTAFYRDPDAVMERVFEDIERLGVRPMASTDAEAVEGSSADDALRLRVVRRATGIMQERGWLPSPPEVAAGLPDALGAPQLT